VDVDLEVASEEWVTSLLLRLAPHATLLAPAAYAQSFTAAARAALRHYEDDGVDSEASTEAPPTQPPGMTE
jgi:proteasome accessory factor C